MDWDRSTLRLCILTFQGSITKHACTLEHFEDRCATILGAEAILKLFYIPKAVVLTGYDCGVSASRSLRDLALGLSLETHLYVMHRSA